MFVLNSTADKYTSGSAYCYRFIMMSCLVQFQLARYECSRDKRREKAGEEVQKNRSKNQMSNHSSMGYSLLFDAFLWVMW